MKLGAPASTFSSAMVSQLRGCVGMGAVTVGEHRRRGARVLGHAGAQTRVRGGVMLQGDVTARKHVQGECAGVGEWRGRTGAARVLATHNSCAIAISC